MKRTLLFTVIASVLTTGAYATSSTVTSKDYVDTQDALKQNTIPATGTNSATPGDTVVTYTDTAGTIGERGICDDSTENGCNGGDLVTSNELGNVVVYVKNQIQNLPETTVTYKTCTEWIAGQSHTDANCILWNLSDKQVYGKCATNSDCTSFDCSSMGNGAWARCNSNRHVCECVIM